MEQVNDWYIGPKCECGLDSVAKQYQYQHSTWCPKYIPKAANTDCNCSHKRPKPKGYHNSSYLNDDERPIDITDWHSPGCINYVPKVEEKFKKPLDINEAIELIYKLQPKEGKK
jgi:hypothetical protein